MKKEVERFLGAEDEKEIISVEVNKTALDIPVNAVSSEFVGADVLKLSVQSVFEVRRNGLAVVESSGSNRNWLIVGDCR